jgi:hypothetical protein
MVTIMIVAIVGQCFTVWLIIFYFTFFLQTQQIVMPANRSTVA